MNRSIFPYRDGSRNWLGFRRTRYADPLVITRGLDRHPTFCTDQHLPAILKYRDGRRATDSKQAREGMHESIEIAAKAARDVFGIEPLSADGRRGLTDMQCVDLLVRFMGFLLDLKKNTSPSPIAAEPTAATSPVSSEPTTSDTSPSFSCDPGSDGAVLTKPEQASSKDTAAST